MDLSRSIRKQIHSLPPSLFILGILWRYCEVSKSLPTCYDFSLSLLICNEF